MNLLFKTAVIFLQILVMAIGQSGAFNVSTVATTGYDTNRDVVPLAKSLGNANNRNQAEPLRITIAEGRRPPPPRRRVWRRRRSPPPPSKKRPGYGRPPPRSRRPPPPIPKRSPPPMIRQPPPSPPKLSPPPPSPPSPPPLSPSPRPPSPPPAPPPPFPPPAPRVATNRALLCSNYQSLGIQAVAGARIGTKYYQQCLNTASSAEDCCSKCQANKTCYAFFYERLDCSAFNGAEDAGVCYLIKDPVAAFPQEGAVGSSLYRDII